MKKILFLTALFFYATFVSAGSLHLFNDSPNYLMAKIFAADGTLLGETVMAPQTWNDWSDDKYKATIPDPKFSLTPYLVHWYCADGGDYSLCSGLGTGATVTAQTCIGTRQCKKPPVDPNEKLAPPKGSFSAPPQYPPEPAPDDSTDQ